MLGIHILLAAVLAAFSNALSPMGVITAMVLVYLVFKLSAGLLGLRSYVRRVELGVCFIGWFAGEVIKASVDVARVVFALGRAPQPAIVRIALVRRNERLATVIGCLLTLTPGTMALQYDAAEGDMYVHALDAESVEQVEKGVRAIESRLLAWIDAGDADDVVKELPDEY